MPSMKIDPSLFPESLVLTATPDPLPRQFRFTVQPLPGFVPQGPILLHFNLDGFAVELAKAELPDPHGFSRALTLLLDRARAAQLWGGKISAIAIAMNDTGNVRVARSAEVFLPAPAAPLLVNDSVLLVPGSGEVPAPTFQSIGQGRRLYRRAQMGGGGPSSMPMLWYVDPAGRLEENASLRGFDVYTFWLAYFGFGVRDSRNVLSGEALSSKLGGQRPRVIPTIAALDQMGPAIAAALSQYPKEDVPGLMWSSQRVVTVGSFSMQTSGHNAHEFGPTGIVSKPFSQWLAGEAQGTVWNYRSLRYRNKPVRPFGMPSL